MSKQVQVRDLGEVPCSPPKFPPFKPTVIGLYGIPGSGKSYLLRLLTIELSNENCLFFDGSAELERTIADLSHDIELETLAPSETERKEFFRIATIKRIQQKCLDGEGGVKFGVVAGHLLLETGMNGVLESIITQADKEVYTHMLYHKVDPQTIFEQRNHDTDKYREALHPDFLAHWQNEEEKQLSELCTQNGIDFTVQTNANAKDTAAMIRKMLNPSGEQVNIAMVKGKIDMIPSIISPRTKTVLVLDGDRTLSAQDTTTHFLQAYRTFDKFQKLSIVYDIFSKLGYTYEAFLEVACFYEDLFHANDFKRFCNIAANNVELYPEILSLLQMTSCTEEVVAVVLTSGMSTVWERVLRLAGLNVPVLGGNRGRVSPGVDHEPRLVMTPATKAAIVTYVRERYQKTVVAFGDSPLDLPMLKAADRAIVVVGDADTRSKPMEKELAHALQHGLVANQVLLPSEAATPIPMRLNEFSLPPVDITSRTFVETIFPRNTDFTRSAAYSPPLHAANLLATPTRDSFCGAPALRDVHRRNGWFLATCLLSTDGLLGLEEYLIVHAQGGDTTGYRIKSEAQTTIVALMRAGLPMAEGISDAMPRASLVPVSVDADLKPAHIRGRANIVLVDAVINEGTTILKWIEMIRTIHASVRIVVVAGVVQEGFLNSGKLSGMANVELVMLRSSQNKYKGTKGVDTGNRLFGTFYLD